MTQESPQPSTDQEIKLLHDSWQKYNLLIHLFNEISDDEFRLDGCASGTFIEYRQRFWIASAGHVMKGLFCRDWLLSYGPAIRLKQNPEDPYHCKLTDPTQIARETALFKFGKPRYRYQKERYGDSPILQDIGIMEIGNPEPIINSGGSDFLRVSRDTLTEPHLGMRTETWGQSIELFTENISQGKPSGGVRVASVITAIGDPNESFFKQKYDNVNQTELIVEQGRVTGQKTRESPLRNLKGLSGGPVWLVPSEPLSQPATPELLGIHVATVYLDPVKLQVATLSHWMDLADELIDLGDGEQNEDTERGPVPNVESQAP